MKKSNLKSNIIYTTALVILLTLSLAINPNSNAQNNDCAGFGATMCNGTVCTLSGCSFFGMICNGVCSGGVSAYGNCYYTNMYGACEQKYCDCPNPNFYIPL
ncbi:MAG: hypothetical protein JJ895_07910 [Balneolaceae bacterium]|nr:hypothetical protein [Balneolaceae bacterium]